LKFFNSPIILVFLEFSCVLKFQWSTCATGR